MSGKPGTPAFCSIALTANLDRGCGFQYCFYFVIGKRLGFPGGALLWHFYAPASERVARQEFFFNGPTEHSSRCANPHICNRLGRSLTTDKRIRPLLHL